MTSADLAFINWRGTDAERKQAEAIADRFNESRERSK